MGCNNNIRIVIVIVITTLESSPAWVVIELESIRSIQAVHLGWVTMSWASEEKTKRPKRRQILVAATTQEKKERRQKAEMMKSMHYCHFPVKEN